MTAVAVASPFVAVALATAFLCAVRRHGRRLTELIAQAGDIDSNGDIIDELRERLEQATGPVGDDRDRHLDLIADLLRRTGARA